MKKTIIIVSSTFIIVAVALFFLFRDNERIYFEFCNEHIIIEEFDIAQNPWYNPDRIDSLENFIYRAQLLSNATRTDLERAMLRYEFTLFIFNYQRTMFLKTFNGIPTNTGYGYSFGSFFKSEETITARQAYEFLQDPRNDPRNFEGEIIPQIEYSEVRSIHILHRIITRNGQLYPVIFVTKNYYDLDGNIRSFSQAINTATGERGRIVHPVDESDDPRDFVREPTFPW